MKMVWLQSAAYGEIFFYIKVLYHMFNHKCHGKSTSPTFMFDRHWESYWKKDAMRVYSMNEVRTECTKKKPNDI